MAFVLAERPAQSPAGITWGAAGAAGTSERPAVPTFKVHGPLARQAELSVACGWTGLVPQWHELQKCDKRELDVAGLNTKYVLGGDRAPAWVPPSQRALPPRFVLPKAEHSSAMKQSHLHGNVGIITNPQPALADNRSFLMHIPANSNPVSNFSESVRPPLAGPSVTARDCKVFEQSSDMFDSSRRLGLSTTSPRKELFDASYPNFPYGDSTLDVHVPKRQASYSQFEDSPPVAVNRSPRAKFEPPARPGAAFRRRREKNYSDLFGHEPPPCLGKNRVPNADMNALSHSHGSFLDTRTEVARRNGETKKRDPGESSRSLLRMRSAPVLDTYSPRDGKAGSVRFADSDEATVSTMRESQSLRRLHSPRGDGPGVRPAGGGGCAGGEAEFVAAAAEEERALIASAEAAARLWDVSGLSDGGDPTLINSDPPPRQISDSRRDFVKDMCRRVFGERQAVDWNAVQSPRSDIPGMKTPRPPRSPRSPPSNSPRRPTSLAGFNEDNLENFACKAAARGRFQRQMSSDPSLLFGVSN